ncbi:helix-turn-helix domain-containing protein [Streptomyces asoensis]|uniref:Helix-turn-helix domain-containing protein n=1 Tax=Streptomyces asoensis TaxID=249586 RepID=A0A6M4WNS9_9ACTN|nr:hypothetical protein [Streptomyces asoensis]QJT01768.1 helix-turn-helix domain-containing protein [Streptomyces asoensis]
MSAVALAASEAAPHPQPPRAAAVVRPRDGGHSIRVPLRLVVGVQYSDAALAVYVKIAALALRPEGCTAKVSVLAEYLGMSKSAVERGLRQLAQPDPLEGLTEVPTTRRTLPGGRGQSAHRTVRPLADGELWVRVPVRAAEALTPRLLRVYALLAYATARRIPVTAAELGAMLHHHTGKQTGESLGERQARRLVDELAATGWLTLHRREGEQGRHAYETHRSPLHAVPAAEQAPATPVIHDGSGAGDHDGSLASKEDLTTDRRLKTQLGGGNRRRRGDRKWVAGPVDNSVSPTFGSGGLVLRTDDETLSSSPAAGRAAYTSPALQLSPRIWRVLEPVRHEVAALSPYVMRRIAREIGAQLDAYGGSEERLHDRLTRRYASSKAVRDFGRWMLGAALVRHGCGDPRCETGVMWDTGTDCETCALTRQVDQARAARDAELAESARLLEERRQQRLRQTAERDQEQQSAHQLPRKLTYREREQAPDDEIRAVMAVHGPVVALHLYGHLRTLPLLDGRLDPDQTGSDRRTHAESQ